MKIMVSLFDKVVGCYMPPFLAENDLGAARAVVLASRQRDTLLHDRPADFDLYEMGSFDERTGLEVNKPEFLMNCGPMCEKDKQERWAEADKRFEESKRKEQANNAN